VFFDETRGHLRALRIRRLAMKPRPVILDVDTGVDDALALMLAFRSPELDVRGILTVSGNVHVSQATANTLAILDLLDAPPIPVAAGAAAPLARPGITAGDVHGSDGLGGAAGCFPPSRRTVAVDAVGFLLDAIGRQPEELTLIATAPLTNLALAIERDAPTVRKLRALFVMGGAVRVPGNLGPVSEFNFAVDPEAAAIVLGAGLPVTLIPLDVTERVVLTRARLDEVKSVRRLHPFVASRRVSSCTTRWRSASSWILPWSAGNPWRSRSRPVGS